MPGSTCFTDEFPGCPSCEGPGMPLGRLGTLDHWQCRHCGLQFHTPADDDPDPWDGSDEW
jgi:ribosomal protein L37AE/L43A